MGGSNLPASADLSPRPNPERSRRGSGGTCHPDRTQSEVEGEVEGRAVLSVLHQNGCPILRGFIAQGGRIKSPGLSLSSPPRRRVPHPTRLHRVGSEDQISRPQLIVIPTGARSKG